MDETLYGIDNLVLTTDSTGSSNLIWSVHDEQVNQIRSSRLANGVWEPNQVVRNLPGGLGRLASAPIYPEGVLAMWSTYIGDGYQVESSEYIGSGWMDYKIIHRFPVDSIIDDISLFNDKLNRSVAIFGPSSSIPGLGIYSISRINGQWGDISFFPYQGTFRAAMNDDGILNLVSQNSSGNSYKSIRNYGGIWEAPSDISQTEFESRGAFEINSNHDGSPSLIFAARSSYYYSIYLKTGSAEAGKLSVDVTGKGVIESVPNGISCAYTCDGYFAKDSVVSLYPKSDYNTGYTFSYWTGACSGAGNCLLKMDGDKQVGATFTVLPSYLLSVTNSANGRVLSKPDGIDCGYGGGQGCKYSFYKDSTVILEAQPREGFVLKKWNGCSSYDGNVCRVVMSKNKSTVTPVFVPLPKYKLTITKTKYGSVISSLGKPKCGPNKFRCSASFPSGTEVTLTLKPTPGRTYTGWEGACSGIQSDTCTLTIDGPKFVGAGFQ